MLMHLVNNLVKKELQEWGLELTTRRGMQWTWAYCFQKTFLNVRSLRFFKQISPLKVTANLLCQELNVPWMHWDCLDILSETHEDALHIHNSCFFSPVSSLDFSFFLRFGRGSYFLLLYMSLNHFFLLSYLLPSSFQLPFVQNDPGQSLFFSLPFLSVSPLVSRMTSCPRMLELWLFVSRYIRN